ncbi:LuxR C-terminal-related transcriptional regulator [Aquabacterium sp. OR-4]|uniref:LuxR C-terminal-related transcriptional regulator n=1 Tax=Aquabacterium sp. OR-4 TaxID=2978127 RepID=UPI0028CA3BBA|nr:LuxR C-terminal-related transcriptional regulator [Aquabacterium sp. OR-4]MDT7837254.1 LuxR C-terminal-related transcriptional regulator [Aquabacterium sp. OR-4]
MTTRPPDPAPAAPAAAPVAAPAAATAAGLAAKLLPPGRRAALVPRHAVTERVVAAGAVKVVLVRAPAGFGKTTAMLQLRERLHEGGVATAWLTLDRADNDLPRFLGSLGAAVAGLDRDEARPLGAPLDAVAALAHEGPPFALFVDDFERVQETAVLGLVSEIIDRLPRRGQLVIGSRSLPPLGLGRLRARGQLLEIDAEALRFTLPEAVAFFALAQQRGREALPAGTVARLHGKTEGWVAALWLVSLALERHAGGGDFVERFSGSNRAVADYLAEDVLAHQPPEVRDFLLRTSILRHLSAPVCKALLPRMDCARLLERLEAANLFLTPIGEDAHSYRYHSMFAAFLRAQLEREHPDELARLHLAASGWYESQGRPVPAIDHAIDGGDHPHALTLLAQHATTFLEQGRMRLLARWFSALPADLVRAQPALQAVAVWAQAFTHGPWEAMALLERSGLAEVADAGVQAHVNALRPLLLAMMDRPEEAVDIGRASLAALPTASPFADSVLLNASAHVLSVLGDQHQPQRLLDAARRAHRDSAFNRMYTESLEGVLDLKQGRLRQATARLRLAVAATPQAVVSYHHTNGNAWAGVLYAGVVYEANELEAAERLLNVYLPLARDVGLPDHMIASHRMRARIAFGQGDIDLAFEILAELEYLGHHRQLPRVVASARLERARLLGLQGNGPGALAELQRADDPAVWARCEGQHLPAQELDDMAIGRLRWDIHFGDARAAVPRLEQALHEAQRSGRAYRALKLQVLLALAWRRAGQAAQATALLATVLASACREGFVRLILDEGPPVAALLQRVQAAADEGSRPADPILADLVQRLLAAAGGPVALDDEAAPAAQGDAPSPETLTRKEIRVLQLLAEGYSNSALAEKLFVSDSTVRTHLRNINTKLGSHSRTQAVAVARRLSVIR